MPSNGAQSSARQLSSAEDDRHLLPPSRLPTVLRQQGWFLGLAELLDVPDLPTSQAASQTEAEVAQAVQDYLNELDWLAHELPEDAPLFHHFRTRLRA